MGFCAVALTVVMRRAESRRARNFLTPTRSDDGAVGTDGAPGCGGRGEDVVLVWVRVKIFTCEFPGGRRGG